jgi:hypothetical protein
MSVALGGPSVSIRSGLVKLVGALELPQTPRPRCPRVGRGSQIWLGAAGRCQIDVKDVVSCCRGKRRKIQRRKSW